ncbi:MAG: bis(5'-nucleosyl)-tetraphosphatase (symmetrical) YqeK [Candidatus Poribacteria bacterium]|nr:bis(5'-nucleosyl)-tetraphosphatase (symmetrical) YqeK [Candidatus Poribacteria bacterium]
MTTSSSDILAYLEKRLSSSRLKHVLGVRDTARMLAERHGEDADRVELAALLHDCAKWMSVKEQFAACEKYDVQLSDDDRLQPSVLHSYVGAEMARKKFGADDVICQAIRAHTTGWSPMSRFDMTLFVADFCEPGRPYDAAVEVREVATDSLERATLLTMTRKLNVLLQRGKLIHRRTVEARNTLLLAMEEPN